MKQPAKIFFASLLAVSLVSSLVACGGKNNNSSEPKTDTEPSSTEPAHVHNYVFDSFIWTKLEDGYSAVAHYVCAADGESVDHDAEVTLTSSVNPTCEAQGSKTYTASYDGHTDTKVEFLPALGHSYTRTAIEGTDGYALECAHCHEKYYELTLGEDTYYFQSSVTTVPTFEQTGTFEVKFYNFDSTKQEFTHLTPASEGTFPYDFECNLSKFSDGSTYVGDTEAKTLKITSSVYITKAIRIATSNAVGLANALAFARVLVSQDIFVFAPEDFDTIYPNMTMKLDIRAGTTFTDGSMTTGTETSLCTVTALRKDNFHLPSNTDGFAYKHQEKDLVGYSNNANSTTTNYSLGGFISASANKVIYCVWDDNHNFDEEHVTILAEPTMESYGSARYYCQTAGHSDYEDRQIAKVKYTFIEDVFETAGNTVLTTTISQGTFKVGDVISICLDNKFKDVTIKTIEKYHESIQEASAGEAVGFGIDSSELATSEVQAGLLITEPGKHLLSTKVEVYGHIYTQEEGGRHAAIANGYRPTFEINGRKVQGTLNFDTDVFGEVLYPGADNDRTATYTITFNCPVYLPYDSTLYPKEGSSDSAKTTAEFTVDSRNELMAFVSDNYTADGTEDQLIYTDTNTLPTQYDYENSYRLRGFDERTTVSDSEDTQFAPSATIPSNMRKVYLLNAIWGDAMFTGKPTAIQTLTGRGTVITLEVKGAAVTVGDEIKIRLKDGTLKDSIVTGVQVDGATQDAASVGETAVLLVRSVSADDLSLTNCFVWAK